MNAHTPGPWRAEPHSLHEISFLITSTAPQSVGGDRTVTVAKFASQADARLIAAAPEMLELAKDYYRLLDSIDGGIEHLERLQKARAVIAKATGEP